MRSVTVAARTVKRCVTRYPVLDYCFHIPAESGRDVRKIRRNCKDVKLTRLVEVFREIRKLSLISRSEGSSSWDFDRSLEFISEQGLQDHIAFISFSARDYRLPMNSEHHILELQNIMVRDLVIEMDDRAAWHGVQDWTPVSYAKLHFERCQFQCPAANMWEFTIPWRGSFRFHKNVFFFSSSRHPGAWIFPFEHGSRVRFVRNDFAGSTIQTRCIVSAERAEDSQGGASHGQGHIAFVGNMGVRELWIQQGYSSVEIVGMNQIDRLMVDLLVDGDEGNQTLIYLGSREKIDPQFDYCLQHRSLFLTMRRLAAMNHDSRQLAVLDRHLERIEYFLNKGVDTPSLLNYWVWIEYWQDRVLYAWRRWSSDFYRSWIRPLALLVIGYLTINAVPVVLVESFSVSDWIELTLRPVGGNCFVRGELGSDFRLRVRHSASCLQDTL